MRCAWRCISSSGVAQRRIDGIVLQQRFQVAGHHRQRRAQFMRRIGHEILAHGFQRHLVGNIAHQHQVLVAAVRHDL